ncbi:hypothetical protein HanRHA438_Chr07g0326961 [Helianthus annuus]|nr:hypothetical protein HanRHA438_Chr07g0326961 [Helianthus annuus]
MQYDMDVESPIYKRAWSSAWLGQLAVESPVLWSESELNYLTSSPVKVYTRGQLV